MKKEYTVHMLCIACARSRRWGPDDRWGETYGPEKCEECGESKVLSEYRKPVKVVKPVWQLGKVKP